MSRGRKYDFASLEGFKDQQIGMAAAMLEEAAFRVYDVLSYADQDKLHHVPEDSYLSVAKLVRHMAWAEVQWISRLCGTPAPDDILAHFGDVGARKLPEVPEGGESADDLCDAIRRLRNEYTVPLLKELDGIDAPFPAAGDPPEKGPNTTRQVLSHLLWHWTYHSGQVGITLLQAGHDYQWGFAKNKV